MFCSVLCLKFSKRCVTEFQTAALIGFLVWQTLSIDQLFSTNSFRNHAKRINVTKYPSVLDTVRLYEFELIFGMVSSTQV